MTRKAARLAIHLLNLSGEASAIKLYHNDLVSQFAALTQSLKWVHPAAQD